MLEDQKAQSAGLLRASLRLGNRAFMVQLRDRMEVEGELRHLNSCASRFKLTEWRVSRTVIAVTVPYHYITCVQFEASYRLIYCRGEFSIPFYPHSRILPRLRSSMAFMAFKRQDYCKIRGVVEVDVNVQGVGPVVVREIASPRSSQGLF